MRNTRIAKAESDRIAAKARKSLRANPQQKLKRFAKNAWRSESDLQRLITEQAGMTIREFQKKMKPEALRNADPVRSGKTIRDWRVAILLERLTENPALSVNDLAAIVNLSTSRLRHLVQKEDLGFNLQTYRKECQLELACRLLHVNDLPLKEIRSRCGIPDGANFNRFFKNCLNTTPGKFRLQAATAFTNK